MKVPNAERIRDLIIDYIWVPTGYIIIVIATAGRVHYGWGWSREDEEGQIKVSRYSMAWVGLIFWILALLLICILLVKC